MRVGERIASHDMTVSAVLPQLAAALGRQHDISATTSFQGAPPALRFDDEFPRRTAGALASATPSAVVIASTRTLERGIATVNGGIGLRVVCLAPVYVVGQPQAGVTFVTDGDGVDDDVPVSPVSEESLRSMGSDELAELLRDEDIEQDVPQTGEARRLARTIGVMQSVVIPY